MFVCGGGSFLFFKVSMLAIPRWTMYEAQAAPLWVSWADGQKSGQMLSSGP